MGFHRVLCADRTLFLAEAAVGIDLKLEPGQERLSGWPSSSQHCQILQQSLAARAAQLGAYADPAWTLTSGPTSDQRPPQQLAPDPGTFTRTVSAVHQATSTLTALAAADYSQTRTAALTGRLLVPAVQVPVYGRNTELYARAPDRRANELLTAYRDAGTASVKATARAEGIIAEHQARDRQPASPTHRRVIGRVVPMNAVTLSEPDPPPGSIEKILSDLGVTDGELLDRGVALDKAAAQLIAEAAERTAPQRWHRAVISPGALTSTTAIAGHVLAADQFLAAVKVATKWLIAEYLPGDQPPRPASAGLRPDSAWSGPSALCHQIGPPPHRGLLLISLGRPGRMYVQPYPGAVIGE